MLLALDTATAQIGLGLYDGVQLTAELVWLGSQHHTLELAPAIFDLLDRTSVSVDEIKAMGVTLGPGSFTSLRVGLALAKGLAMARHIPLIGIPTLDVVAAGQPLKRMHLAAVLQAGRGRLAVGWYEPARHAWRPAEAARVMDVEELVKEIRSPTIVCGELTAEERQRLARKHKNVLLPSPAACLRRPGVLAELAWERWQAGQDEPLASLSPIYLQIEAGQPA